MVFLSSLLHAKRQRLGTLSTGYAYLHEGVAVLGRTTIYTLDVTGDR